MNKALDEVRAEETRRMKREGRDPVLKKSRWLLLKRSENLDDEQHFRLRDLLRYNLKTVRAYLLKEAFQQLWDYNSPAWAGKFLDEWCRQTMRSRIEPMKKIARSLRQHRELILNYFRAQKLLSSGVVEGLNNKAKVTMRKSYGFRTYRVLELALYHSLGKLPEPESTHDFFVTQPFSYLKSMFSMLTDYNAPRNDIEDAPNFRQSRFDVASVVRPHLDNLIQSREQSLSAEYHFLAGEYERVVTLFEKRRMSRSFRLGTLTLRTVSVDIRGQVALHCENG